MVKEYRNEEFGKLFTDYLKKHNGDIYPILKQELSLKEETLQSLIQGMKKGNLLGNVSYVTNNKASLNYLSNRLAHVFFQLNVEENSKLVIISKRKLESFMYPPIGEFIPRGKKS